MGKIIITGTPGSGKTTILSKLKIDIRKINLADEMLKTLAKNGITHHDQVRHIPYPTTAKIRSGVIREINKIAEDALIDTHTSVKSKFRYIPGFSKADLDEFNDVKGIIYIEAHVNEILMRRLQDKTRNRENDFEDEIQEQRRVNVSLASYYAAYLDIPLYIIMNRQNMVDNAVAETEKAIEDAMGRGEW